MFTERPCTQSALTVRKLNAAYLYLIKNNWTHGGVETVFLDILFTDVENLKHALTYLCNELNDGNTQAANAAALLDYLYHHGYKGGFKKDEIQACFHLAFPKGFIRGMDADTVSEKFSTIENLLMLEANKSLNANTP